MCVYVQTESVCGAGVAAQTNLIKEIIRKWVQMSDVLYRKILHVAHMLYRLGATVLFRVNISPPARSNPIYLCALNCAEE